MISSSNPISGNTVCVYVVMYQLSEAGAEVIYGKVYNVHTSGHGGVEDVKLSFCLIKPKSSMAAVGEYRS